MRDPFEVGSDKKEHVKKDHYQSKTTTNLILTYISAICKVSLLLNIEDKRAFRANLKWNIWTIGLRIRNRDPIN